MPLLWYLKDHQCPITQDRHIYTPARTRFFISQHSLMSQVALKESRGYLPAFPLQQNPLSAAPQPPVLRYLHPFLHWYTGHPVSRQSR